MQCLYLFVIIQLFLFQHKPPQHRQEYIQLEYFYMDISSHKLFIFEPLYHIAVYTGGNKPASCSNSFLKLPRQVSYVCNMNKAFKRKLKFFQFVSTITTYKLNAAIPRHLNQASIGPRRRRHLSKMWLHDEAELPCLHKPHYELCNNCSEHMPNVFLFSNHTLL